MPLWNRPRANGGSEERKYALGAGGLPEDGNIARVAAKGGDVLLHPLQGRDLIQQAGGAYIFGSGAVPHNGAGLARRGAVVVTLNYRLMQLGFFAHLPPHWKEQRGNDDAIEARRCTEIGRHLPFSGWRQLKVFGPRRSKAMCLDERSDQSKWRPNAPVTTLRLACPTVRNPGTTSGLGAL